MEKMFTYINFKNLKDDELDKDFKNKCFQNGANNNTKVNATKLPCITGHDAYVITLVEEK